MTPKSIPRYNANPIYTDSSTIQPVTPEAVPPKSSSQASGSQDVPAAADIDTPPEAGSSTHMSEKKRGKQRTRTPDDIYDQLVQLGQASGSSSAPAAQVLRTIHVPQRVNAASSSRVPEKTTERRITNKNPSEFVENIAPASVGGETSGSRSVLKVSKTKTTRQAPGNSKKRRAEENASDFIQYDAPAVIGEASSSGSAANAIPPKTTQRGPRNGKTKKIEESSGFAWQEINKDLDKFLFK